MKALFPASFLLKPGMTEHPVQRRSDANAIGSRAEITRPECFMRAKARQMEAYCKRRPQRPLSRGLGVIRWEFSSAVRLTIDVVDRSGNQFGR